MVEEDHTSGLHTALSLGREEVGMKQGGADSMWPRVAFRCFKSRDGSKCSRLMHLGKIQLLAHFCPLDLPGTHPHRVSA